jgi:hypothetical protein
VATALTVGEYTRLADLERGGNELEWFTWCDLEGGHEGPWHWAHAQSALDGAWWLRWQPTARELVTRPVCPAESQEPGKKDPEPCLLHEGHVGAHTFQFSIPEGQYGTRHPALTVGELRRALDGLGDDTPVRIGAASEEVLPVDTECLLAGTGVGRVRVPGAEYVMPQEALVLMVGLSFRPGSES